jgi:hypothetical protein
MRQSIILLRRNVRGASEPLQLREGSVAKSRRRELYIFYPNAWTFNQFSQLERLEKKGPKLRLVIQRIGLGFEPPTPPLGGT